MRKMLVMLVAAALAWTSAQGQTFRNDRQLTLNVGSSLGDFQSRFTWGVSFILPIRDSLRVEPEVYYYFHPTELSPTPGLSVTSTGLSLGLSYLFHKALTPRIIVEAGVALGVLYVSETLKYSAPKGKESRLSSESYLSPAVALQFRFDARSGIRFDARYLYIPWDGRRIPRLTMGYILWY